MIRSAPLESIAHAGKIAGLKGCGLNHFGQANLTIRRVERLSWTDGCHDQKSSKAPESTGAAGLVRRSVSNTLASSLASAICRTRPEMGQN